MNTSCFLAQAPHPWVFCWGSRAGSGRGIPPWSSSPETPREAPEGPWSSLCCMIKQVALINCLPSQQEIQGLDHDLGSAGCAFHQGPENQTAVWCIGLWLALRSGEDSLWWLSTPLYIILHSIYHSQHTPSCLGSEAREAPNGVGVPLGHGLPQLLVWCTPGAGSWAEKAGTWELVIPRETRESPTVPSEQVRKLISLPSWEEKSSFCCGPNGVLRSVQSWLCPGFLTRSGVKKRN